MSRLLSTSKSKINIGQVCRFHRYSLGVYILYIWW
jgi:hypothetical protein